MNKTTTEQDNKALIEFWDQALLLSEDETVDDYSNDPDEWKQLAPSEKLFEAACSLGRKKKVLDYGCGNAWAGIIAAKSGCPDVTAVDVATGPVRTAEFYAGYFGVTGALKAQCVPTDWLQNVPDNTYDGFVCSNVIDVVPTETAEAIISEAARIVTGNAAVIIGMNYYMSPEACAARGIELAEGNKLYVDGVLRLVSRSDDEWKSIFAPYFTVERLEHFAWPGEQTEARRLFYLRKTL